MTKEDKKIIDRAVKENWRMGDRSRLKRLLEKNLEQYRDKVELENENRLLGERCNQLLKDKGDLTDLCDKHEDEICKLFAEKEQLAQDNFFQKREISILKQQIVKMKRHCNCKHRDGEGYCEVKRTYLMDLSYDGCDKWELED